MSSKRLKPSVPSCPTPSSTSSSGKKQEKTTRRISKVSSALRKRRRSMQRKLLSPAERTWSQQKELLDKLRTTARKTMTTSSSEDVLQGKEQELISPTWRRKYARELECGISPKSIRALFFDMEAESSDYEDCIDPIAKDRLKSGSSGGKRVLAKPDECGNSQTSMSCGSIQEDDGSTDSTVTLQSCSTTSMDRGSK